MKRVWFFLLLLSASGFVLAQDSSEDAKVAELVQKTEAAMGGREAYDALRYISWNFFGRRLHLWDKHENRYRVQTIEEDMVVNMDLDTKEGTIVKNGEEITDPEEKKRFMQEAYEIWINDSYWLVMPWKLQDPGVTLRYAREDKTEAGRDAHVLTMTFEEVGVTPENKYEIFIDKEDHLIKQWAFYATAEDEAPRFTLPWGNWKEIEGVMFSDDRGKYNMGPIGVHKQLDDVVFTSTDPATLKQLMGL